MGAPCKAAVSVALYTESKMGVDLHYGAVTGLRVGILASNAQPKPAYRLQKTIVRNASTVAFLSGRQRRRHRRDVMAQQVWIAVIPRPAADEIIVVKISDENVHSRWQAQRIMNALRAKLPLEQIAHEIVLLTAESIEQNAVLGSSPDAEAYVRRLTPQLSSYKWHSKDLDW